MKRGENGPFCWQSAQWPRFHWDHAALAAPVARVRFKQGRLIGSMGALGLLAQGQASVDALSEDAIRSSAIEGVKLELAQVRSSVARRLKVKIPDTVNGSAASEGIADMVVDASRGWNAPLTAERLWAWHGWLFPDGHSDDSTSIRVGAWRGADADPMQVISGAYGRERVHFTAPPAERVAAEMQRFCAAFEAAPFEAICHAGVMHVWFLTMHPFEDGNGRIARALTDMALARSECSPQRFYSMSAQIKAHQRAYYDILESTQRGNLDVTAWLLWFCERLEQAIDTAVQATRNVFDKNIFWERHADVTFNARQRGMLDRLLEGFEGSLTSSKWAKIQKCSQDTATRDIQDLIAKGVLRQNAAGGRSTSYSLNDA